MNAGRVELDLVAVGKDQVSAMLRQVDAQLKKTAGAMGETGAAAGGVGAKIDALKEATKPINKVREGFENLKANAGLVIGAVVGVVAAVKAMSEAFSYDAEILARWHETQKGVEESLEQTASLIRSTREKLGAAPLSEFQIAGDKIAKNWEDIREQINAAEDAVSVFREELASAMRAPQGWSGDAARAAATKALSDAMTKLNKLQSAESDLREVNLKLMEREKRTLQDIVRALKDANEQAELFAKLFTNPMSLEVDLGPFSGAGGPGMGVDKTGFQFRQDMLDALPKPVVNKEFPKKSGGGGGPKQTAQEGRDAVMGTGKWAAPEDKLEAIIGDPATRWLERKTAEEERLVERSLALAAAMGEGWEEVPAAPLAAMATDAEKVRDALTQVANSIGLVTDKFPELGSALAEVSAISDKFAAGQATLAEALAAGGVAIVANAAKAVGGVRAEAAVRAAYEVGMGFATLANPVESAGHFTAGALLGAVAAGAGGGSKGGGSKGGGSRASVGGSSAGSGSSGGPTTIVNNFAMGIGDRQTITLALRQSERTSRGTGASSRAGV